MRATLPRCERSKARCRASQVRFSRSRSARIEAWSAGQLAAVRRSGSRDEVVGALQVDAPVGLLMGPGIGRESVPRRARARRDRRRAAPPRQGHREVQVERHPACPASPLAAARHDREAIARVNIGGGRAVIAGDRARAHVSRKRGRGRAAAAVVADRRRGADIGAGRERCSQEGCCRDNGHGTPQAAEQPRSPGRTNLGHVQAPRGRFLACRRPRTNARRDLRLMLRADQRRAAGRDAGEAATL